MKTKKISFQKKIQVWEQSTNQIPHLYFFLNEIFFISKKITSVGVSAFQKNLQVLNQPHVIWDIAKFRKNEGKND